MGESRLNITPDHSILPLVAEKTGKKPRIESNHLFQGTTEIVIVHQKEEYNLRITSNGKLILTK